MAAFLPNPSPEIVREALIGHLARKLGWSGRTVAHVLEPLSNDAIARCLDVDATETRRALFDHIAAVLGDAPARRAA